MITGSIVALITPFNEDGGVNYNKLKELIEWHIEEGTDGILALGTTAETPALTDEEEEKIAEIAIKTCRGKVPVIVGSGSNSTDRAVEKSLKFEKMGADALLVTGDRDALQLVNENTTVLLAGTGQTTAFTPAVFTEKDEQGRTA